MAVIFGLGAAILKFRPDPLEFRPVLEKKMLEATKEQREAALELYDHMKTNIGASAWEQHTLSRSQQARHHGELLEMWYDGHVHKVIREGGLVAPGGVIVLRVVDGLGTPSATLAAIKKETDGERSWWYAEYDARGEPVSMGRTDRCLRCHEQEKPSGQDRFLFAPGAAR